MKQTSQHDMESKHKENKMKPITLFTLLLSTLLLSFGLLSGCVEKVERACQVDTDCPQNTSKKYCLEGVCSQRACQSGAQKDCYEGDPKTKGVGLCKGGFTICQSNGLWSACLEQILPKNEICDRVDNNCDGTIDNLISGSCVCKTPGTQQKCYSGETKDLGKGECFAGIQTCEDDYYWGPCLDQGLPSAERCDNKDNDCNGLIDDHSSCSCKPGDIRPCYNGPSKTFGIGLCKAGSHTCDKNGQWGKCTGDKLPSTEEGQNCNNEKDDDCDGLVDEGCTCAKVDQCDGPGKPCVNRQTDKFHCGTCGNKCQQGSICQEGKCVCAPGFVLCEKLCVNLQNNDEHCGKCNGSCGNVGRCLNGKCSCPSGYEVCQGTCINFSDNALHCGKCQAACSTGSFCKDGKCTCPIGLTLCGGKCVDAKSDGKHCGKCNTVCKSGELCWQGFCKTCSQSIPLCGQTCCPTSGGLKCCGSSCANIKLSASHCGGCGKACKKGQICSNGTCKCPTALKDCTTQCADTNTSLQHCGKCGIACKKGQTCDKGSCKCPVGLQVCGNACVDVKLSQKHCGKCNNACAAGAICFQGTCKCGKGFAVCPSTPKSCIDLNKDIQNCGFCGNACLSSCTNGECDCKNGETRRCGPKPCVNGQQTCTNGKWDVCKGTAAPTKEICNNKDDNCDGTIDNIPLTEREYCDSKYQKDPQYAKSVCKETRKSCLQGKWIPCQGIEFGPKYQKKETLCDGLDNDCNGKVDESCQTCFPTYVDAPKWNAETGFLHTQNVVFHPAGHLLATTGDEGYVKIWNVAPGQKKGIPIIKFQHASRSSNGAVDGIAFSPDGRLLYSSGRSGDIKVWSLISRKFVRSFSDKAKATSVGRIVVHPSGKYLLTVGKYFIEDPRAGDTLKRDMNFHLWDIQKGKIIQTYKHHTKLVSKVVFINSGKNIISSSFDGKVVIWDTQTGIPGKRLTVDSTGVRDFALHPGEKYIVALSRQSKRATVVSLNFPNGSLISLVALERSPVTLLFATFDASGGVLAMATAQTSRVNFWDTRDPNPSKWRLHSTLHGDRYGMRALAWSQQGNALAIVEAHSIIRILRCPADCIPKKLKTKFTKSHKGGISALDFRINIPTQFVSAGTQGTLSIWDINKSTFLVSRPAHSSKKITSASFCPYTLGGTLSTSSEDESAATWSTLNNRDLTKKPVLTRQMYHKANSSTNPLVIFSHKSKVNDTAWDPYTQQLVTTGDDGHIKIWSMFTSAKGSHVKTLLPKFQQAYKIAFQQSGKFFAVTHGNKTFTLWDFGRFRQLGHRQVGTVPARAIAFNPDGNIIITGTQLGQLKLWTVRSNGIMPVTPQGLPRKVHRDPSAINGIVFSPNGKYFALISDNKTLEFRETAKPTVPISTLTVEHTSAVTSLAWSKDGRHVLTGTKNGEIRLWQCQ